MLINRMLSRRQSSSGCAVFLAALAIALPIIVLASAASAQSPLGVGSAEPSFVIGGPFGTFFSWINEHQAAFYRSLKDALIAMRQDPLALSGLIGLSFAYGIFHAAGPGHGKAVISSYMIANEVELRRGVAISFISSLLQGLVAVAAVGLAFLVLRHFQIQLTTATHAMEIASFALIAAFGAWLLFKKLRTLRLGTANLTVSEPVSQFAGFSARPGKGAGTGLTFQAVEVDDHDYGRSGDYCEACGISHMPDPTLLRGREFNFGDAWSAIIAVGLRPCSGAILVMSFSFLNGLFLGGVLSVLAMSLGTAITVTILASLAVGAKDLALRFAGPGSRTGARIGHAVEIGGALFVLLIGLTLLGAALQG
jgi:ABC-type nickel/cobalt efflux system permease component RcnA